MQRVKKIMIIGSCGAGKSTLAQQLHDITHLPLIHLDQHFWQPNWIESERADWIEKVEQLAAQDTWIIDGNYNGTMSIRLAAADLVIFLDRSTTLCLYRVLKRIILNYGRTRSDMAPDCRERFDLPFLHYVLFFNRIKRPKIVERLEAWRKVVDIRTLKSDQDINVFLESMKRLYQV
jgi:adenylate kinase family enzyme